MARWDEILSLPVQNPPTLEISAADLVWSKVEGWRDTIDRVALIPFARVDDFVRGESSTEECPTRFHVEARRRRPLETAYKTKVDGILEYILYWCSFGPDDHRKGGVVRPSRSTYVSKKKPVGRPNTKRGCTCHFIVKRLIVEPSVALLIYNQDKHVDKKGLPCHGPQDTMAAGTRAMYAPYISEDLRLRVISLLYVGVSVETIMKVHDETVEKQGGPCNRDDLLTHRYVRRQERSIRRSTCELDVDDAVSVSMWVESHQNQVFFYEDFSDSDPFILGIQTEWQLQQLIRFGKDSLVATHSRFGTNKMKHPIHSIIVFNSDYKAIPVAWVIGPRSSCSDTYKWMRALYNRVRTKDPTWKLAGFIVDDPLADILTIREVFQCSVLISFWRVRHAWHKNLMKRCLEIGMCVELSRRLGQAVNNICRGHGTLTLFEDFMDDFVDAADFMDYFKAVWCPRLASWINALKTLPLASQETSAAMELYHNQMKLRVLNEDPRLFERADWLAHKLATKVHSYFWLDEYSRKDDFARYWKDEWLSGLTAWRKSLKIPDSDVIIEGKCTKVTDQEDRNRTHLVFNPGSEFAICDCSWAEMGNLCEHVFKVVKIHRDKRISSPSISMSQYNKALIDMLHCPPNDSLIRDHAVSLAAWVQKKLSTLVHPGTEGSEGTDSAHCTNESTSFQEESCTVIGEEDPVHVMIDAGDELLDQVTKHNASLDMEVDSVPICTYPSGSFSTNIFLENGESAWMDTSPDLPSKNNAFMNTNGCEDDILDKGSCVSLLDMELHSLPAMSSQNQNTLVRQNGVSINDENISAVRQTFNMASMTDIGNESLSIANISKVSDDEGVSEEVTVAQNESGSTIENYALLEEDNHVALAGLEGTGEDYSNVVYDVTQNPASRSDQTPVPDIEENKEIPMFNDGTSTMTNVNLVNDAQIGSFCPQIDDSRASVTSCDADSQSGTWRALLMEVEKKGLFGETKAMTMTSLP